MNTLRTILVFIFVVFATTINIKGDGVPDDYVCKRITNKIVEIKGERNMIYFEGPYTHFETFNSQQAASERGLRLISETDAYEWKKKEKYLECLYSEYNYWKKNFCYNDEEIIFYYCCVMH